MEAKQQELKRIEEAKQKVVDQGKENINSGNKKNSIKRSQNLL
jgi:hypothetical protein